MHSERYSWWSLFRHGLRHNRDWQPAYRRATLADSYDVIIIGGGGHGLATAYYLAKEHRPGRIAVLERGWLGGGNTARNTTIVRSNYLWSEAAALFEHSLRLWEGLTADLNFNVLFSQRGVYNLGHTLQDMRDIERRANANILQGVDVEVVDAKTLKERIPLLDCSRRARYPVMGASFQPLGGRARQSDAQPVFFAHVVGGQDAGLGTHGTDVFGAAFHIEQGHGTAGDAPELFRRHGQVHAKPFAAAAVAEYGVFGEAGKGMVGRGAVAFGHFGKQGFGLHPASIISAAAGW